jgi:hypothetical protein
VDEDDFAWSGGHRLWRGAGNGVGRSGWCRGGLREFDAAR